MPFEAQAAWPRTSSTDRNALLGFPRPVSRVGEHERLETVFPVGMYAACSFVVGTVAHASGITDFARVWVWVGLAVWAVVFAAMLHRGYQLSRQTPTRLDPVRIDEPVAGRPDAA